MEILGDTSHIVPSIPVVEATSHVRSRPSVSSPIWIPEPRRVTIGNTTYITSHVPLSSIPSSSNAIPPPHSHGPSGQNIATSHVHTATAHTVVSQSQEPLVVSGGHIPVFGSSYGPSQGVLHVPNYGHSHGTSHGTPYEASHGQSYGSQYGQNY